jgi:alpha-D-ribose 1-methylphosphonate 5-triphosphate synthase subunit PhnI
MTEELPSEDGARKVGHAAKLLSILTDPNPPALDNLPIDLTTQEAARISARVMTIGEVEYKAATALAGQKKTAEAIEAFSRLRREYRGSWIDRAAAQQLHTLNQQSADKK